MKKNKQLFIAGIILLMCVGIGSVVFALFLRRQDDKYIKSAEENDISRNEWIEMLCEQSGLTEYQNEEAYYQDVPTGSYYFPYIQSSVEWNVLSDKDKTFEGEEYASGRFVALTAMKSIGEGKLRSYLESEADITDAACIELAIEHGLIEKEQLAEGVSVEESGQVLEKLKSLYFTEFWKDDYEEVVYQDGVIELSSGDILHIEADGSHIMVDAQIKDELTVGTIIVFEQKNTGLRLAREVTEIETDGTLSLKEVELDQVLESLTVSDITELTFEDIVNYYEAEENVQAANSLRYEQTEESLMDMSVFSANMNSKGYKLELSTEEEDGDKHLEIKITDNATKVTKTLPIDIEMSQDSGFSVEIDIKKILIGGQINYRALHGGLQYAEVAVDVDSTLKGEIGLLDEEKKIPLYKTPVPLGNGVVGVGIQIYLVLSAEGTISFEAELPLAVALYYEKDRGLKNLEPETSPKLTEIEVNCDVKTMLGFEPTLAILGCLDVMDVETEAGVEAQAESTLRPNGQTCADISVSFPVLTLSVGGDKDADTLIDELGLSVEWNIFAPDKEEDKALFESPIQLALHFEELPDQTVQYVEECTYNKERDRKEDAKSDTEGRNIYYTRYKELTGIDSPVFCFDYSNGWDVSMEEINPPEYGVFYVGEVAYANEVVELTNERGVAVTFIKIDGEIFDIIERNRYYSSYHAEKIADTELAKLDENVSDNFVVVKLTCDWVGITGVGDEERSEVCYAVMQESIIDEAGDSLHAAGLLGFEEMISFHYPTPYVFYASAPDGQFSNEEEKEVIAILSSFREAQ